MSLSQVNLFARKYPVHLVLLPLFFILNIYTQFAGLINRTELGQALLFIICGILITSLIFWMLFRDITKTGIAVTLAGIFYLFFGNIKEMMSQVPVLEYIAHYKIMLPILLLLFIFLVLRLRKKKSPYQLNLFLNILLLIYTGIELYKYSNLNRKQVVGQLAMKASNETPVKQRPDIYYILLDCYPASSYQKQYLGVQENELDSNLINRGFFVVEESQCNYRSTAFSVASVFNMNYIDWMQGVNYVKPYHYNRAMKMVEWAPAFEWLKQSGYQLYNLSIFDIQDQPSIKKERFLSTTGTEIIFYNTLYKCLRRDVIPALFPKLRTDHIRQQKANNKKLLGGFKHFNQQVKDSLQNIAADRTDRRSKFVYAHFELPHFPYFFDSSGNENPEAEIFGPEMISNAPRFKGYISYTNRQVTSIVDSLLLQNSNAVIIIQSDHGFNDFKGNNRLDVFRNYTAYYFPDRDYALLRHDLSNVNTFRIIFNKYFGQQLPLLPDSSIYNK